MEVLTNLFGQKLNIFTINFLICQVSFVISMSGNKGGALKINRHLKLTATKNPMAGVPGFAAVQSGTFEAELLDMLAERLNFTYDMIPAPEMVAGVLLANGSWTGATGLLQREEVEMCASTTSPSMAARQVVDTSYPVSFVDTAILIPFPSELSKGAILFTPFTMEIWLCLGGSCVFVILVSWAISKLTNQNYTHERNKDTLSYWIFYYIGVLTSQGRGEVLPNARSAFRVFTVFCFLSFWLTSNYYTGIYTSLLAVPIYKPAVRSIEDLAGSKTIKALSIKGTSTDVYLITSRDPPLKKLAEQLLRHPEQRLANVLSVDDISTVIGKDKAFIITQTTGLSLVHSSYLFNGKQCKVTMAEKTFWKRPQSYMYVKNSPLREIIDKQLLMMQQAGLIDYAERKTVWEDTRNPCIIFDRRRRNQQEQPIVAFRLIDLVGAFYILAAGFSAGILVLLFERIIFAFRHQNPKP